MGLYMTVTFSIPQNVERLLAEDGQDLNLAAKEAALVELYRREKISHGELAQALGLSRYETDGVLRKHGVIEDLITREELQAQIASLGELLA
jgi:predicted HTH domain antitoxin